MTAKNDVTNSRRIAINTAVLYARTLLTMFISLYTSRVILEVLGVEDFGIYNVVGGVVVLFSFLNSAMSSATQRYFSFALGQGNVSELNKLFSLTLQIHVALGLLLVLLAETVGLWFLTTQLTIPAERMFAAHWVYQFSILTFFLGIVSVPYNALIVSYERFTLYAYVSLFETFAKLAIVFLLSYALYDRLILYAGSLALVSVLVRLFYGFYCSRSFPSIRFRYVRDDAKVKELFAYATWNLFGSLAAVGFSQGISILLNIFFGPLLNAAQGIANQVNGAILSFVGNFQTALNPQIVKSYAADNRAYMQQLIFQGSRLSYYLLLILMLPVFLHTDLLLGWWLKEVPDYAVVFTQLVMLNALINSFSGPLMTAAQATGQIRLYQALVGGILLMNVPVSYAFLHQGYPAQTVMYVMIVISILATLARLFLLQRMGVLQAWSFIKRVLLSAAIPSALIAIALYFTLPLLDGSTILLFLVRSVFITLLAITSIYFTGLRAEERLFIRQKATLLKIRLLS